MKLFIFYTWARVKLKINVKTVILSSILFLFFVNLITVAYASPSSGYIGLSGYPTSTSQINQIIDTMTSNGLNTYRISFNPEWFSGKPHPYMSSYVQYFLDNSDFMIIVDRNHIYPPQESGAAEARNNWQVAKNSIFEVLESWPNNPRVAIELINEYVSDDFYSRMQGLVDDIRAAGFTNLIVVNKWNQPWTKIIDPLDNTYQGYHFYFNSWSVSGAMEQMNIAFSRGIKIINTEVGADFNEYSQFDSAEVQELVSFLEQSEELGIGNTVWLNENLNNWPRYQTLGLTLPTVSAPVYSPSPTNSPTPNPTNSPTPNPTNSPTPNPTNSPTPNPTNSPTPNPTNSPYFDLIIPSYPFLQDYPSEQRPLFPFPTPNGGFLTTIIDDPNKSRLSSSLSVSRGYSIPSYLIRIWL